jgi:UDP-N-acetylglucosamine acyltransferase
LSVSRIDPTARVAEGARLADDVDVGPFCIVGPDVELGAGVRLVSHVNVAGLTRIGERTIVYPFASLGTPPQSLTYRGEPTRLTIGADCTIREGVTMNPGTQAGGGATTVGDRGFFMVNSHVAHDCHVGSDVIFANSATLGGHCVIGDHVFIGGLAAVHQYTHIGAHAMISGVCGVPSDVIPFGMAYGVPARLRGINLVGMRRRKFTADNVRAVRTAYRVLFLSKNSPADQVAAAQAETGGDPAADQVIAFVRERRRRPICRPGAQQDSQEDAD